MEDFVLVLISPKPAEVEQIQERVAVNEVGTQITTEELLLSVWVASTLNEKAQALQVSQHGARQPATATDLKPSSEVTSINLSTHYLR